MQLEQGQLIYLFDVADRWVILELLQKCQELNLLSSENHLGNLLWICHDQLREVVWVLADVRVFPVHLSEVLVDGESKEGVSLATHQSHLELIANLDLFHWHRDDTEMTKDGLVRYVVGAFFQRFAVVIFTFSNPCCKRLRSRLDTFGIRRR